MPRRAAIALFLLALPLLGQPALGQATTAFGRITADTTAPVEVSADALSVNQRDGSATFKGNVVIAQGDMRLGADSVTVIYAAGGQQKISRLTATGGVTLVSGEDAAEAKEAVYDVVAGNVTLTGDVMLTQGSNLLAGESMVVNLADGTATVQGRVRSVIQPGGN